jgi:hypothetical protein
VAKTKTNYAKLLQYLTLFSVLLLVSCGEGGGGGDVGATVAPWTKEMGVAGAYTYGYSTATDTSGNVYVAGYTTGGLDGNTLTGTYDFFLTKYNSAGNK